MGYNGIAVVAGLLAQTGPLGSTASLRIVMSGLSLSLPYPLLFRGIFGGNIQKLGVFKQAEMFRVR